MSTLTPSRIESVTVYRRGARVTRAAAIADAAVCGDVIRIGDLPLTLEDRSIRIRIDGGPGLAATDVAIGLEAATVDPSAPPVESAEIRAARREVTLLQSRQKHLAEQGRRLGQAIAVPRPGGKRGEAPPPSPHAGRRAVAEFRQAQLRELDRQGEEVAEALRGARERLSHLEARDREASSARQAEAHEMKKCAVIHLSRRAGASGSRRILIEYMIPGARWAPAYTVTFDRAMKQASVAVRAVVAQRSGEDWERVKITLSTADAQRWTELPELQSLRIGRRQPPVAKRGWRPPPVGAGELYGDYDRFQRQPGPMQEAAITGSYVVDEDFDDDDEGGGGDEQPKTESALLPPPMPGAYDGMTRSGGYAPPPAPFPMSASMPPPGALVQPSPAAKPARQPSRARTSAPAPSADMPMEAVARKGGGVIAGIASALGGGGGGPQGFGAPADKKRAMREFEPEPEEPGNLLAYGDLRMHGASDPRRGRLVLVRREERVRELIVLREVRQVTEVIGVLDAARRAALDVGGELPPRHALPESVGGFDYVYVADGEVEVVSDGEYHAIPLLARSAPVEMIHVVVPRESTDVFRVAALKNPLDAPLLAGPADVYLGGDYLLTSDLALAAARGEVRLGLGVEQSIKVARNTRYAEESAGLMGGSLILRHTILVDLQNRLDRPATVEVRERIPSLPEGETEITVEPGPVEPPWERYEPEDYTLKGGQRWRITIPAGAKHSLRAGYSVKIASKKELVGGNRREA
ncbi:MAG: DUF4139 domain-containing protein [Nannocystaceae bacterium]